MSAFGKIRHTTIKGEKGTDWYVELWKEGHTDASIDMTLAGEGFEVTWNGQGSTRNRNFLGSECVLNLFVQNDTDEDLLYNILASGFKKYFIRIYKNSTAASSLWWFGWISPAFDTIENAPYPYTSSITATDSYGYYDKRPIDTFEADGADNYTVVMDRNKNIADICVDFIKNMGLYTDAGGDNHPFPGGTGEDFIRISMEWALAADVGQSPPPIERYYISKAAYVLNENFPKEYKESDVFKDILKVFNLTGVLAEGKYYFFQPNRYLNNASGGNVFYGYDDITPVANSGTTVRQTALTINQTNHILLGGSTFTYEAPLKSTQVTYKSKPSYFFIPEDYEITYGTNFSGGHLQDLSYRMTFDMTHSVEVDLSTSAGGWATSLLSGEVYETRPTLFSTTVDLEIKISNGSTTKWLYVESSGLNYPGLQWSATQKTITLHRGNQSNYQPPSNMVSNWNDGWDGNATIGNPIAINGTDGPCFMLRDNSSGDRVPINVVKSNTSASTLYVEFKTDIVFDSFVPASGVDQGTLTVNIATPDVTLTQRGYDNPSGYSGSSYYIERKLNGGSRQNSKGVINEFTFERDATSSTEAKEVFYRASQTQNTAIEQLDLGDVIIGQSNDPKTSVRDSNKDPILSNFQVGSDASTSTPEISRLLVDQFLEMQITPLQILQGSIQSANISPLNIIKYKLNSDDADFGYYMFLGGTFKANSEIMDGEWFKLKKD